VNTEQTASRLIDASVDQVRSVLLDPLALPDWNPAFRNITGPAVGLAGENYQITVHPGLAGRFAYISIEPDLITTEWEVLGFAETGSWQLTQRGGRTEVSHSFAHTGPLAAILSRAYRGVAPLRLTRLARRMTDTALQR